jgi:hypothetical protein
VQRSLCTSTDGERENVNVYEGQRLPLSPALSPNFARRVSRYSTDGEREEGSAVAEDLQHSPRSINVDMRLRCIEG